MWAAFSNLHRNLDNAILTRDERSYEPCRSELRRLCPEFLHIEKKAVSRVVKQFTEPFQTKSADKAFFNLCGPLQKDREALQQSMTQSCQVCYFTTTSVFDCCR